MLLRKFLTNFIYLLVFRLHLTFNQVLAKESSQMHGNILRVFKMLQTDYQHTVIYYSSSKCIFTEILEELHERYNWPVLLWSSELHKKLAGDIIHKELLIVGCEQHFNDTVRLMEQLTARRLLQLQANTTYAVQEYCESCRKYEIVNTILLLEDFQQTGHYYNCLVLPPKHDKNYLKKNIKDSKLFAFYSQFMNMQHSAIRTEFDYYPTSSVEDEEMPENGYAVRGYLANLITTFARRHNATLIFTKRLNKTHLNDDLTRRTHLGEFDVATGLSAIMNEWLHYTYPYEISAMCIMNPVEKDMHMSAVFAHILPWPMRLMLIGLILIFALLLNYTLYGNCSWLLLILDSRALRGMLGQSFPLPKQTTLLTKFICLLLFIASLVIVTTFNAMSGSYLTRPPKVPGIRYYEDLARLNLKILLNENTWIAAIRINDSVLLNRRFFVLVSPEEFLKMRTNFEPGYVFPVLHTLWIVIEQHLRYIPTIHFEYNDDFCFSKMALAGLPIRPNLPYREQLDLHILDMQEMGLKKFWLSHTYHHLKRLGHTKELKPRPDNIFGTVVELSDFDLIWNFYLISSAMAIVCFCGELLLYHAMRCLRLQRRKLR